MMSLEPDLSSESSQVTVKKSGQSQWEVTRLPSI